MTQLVGVPDPIHEELKKEAKRLDSTMGEVVREWRRKATLYDELENDFIAELKTRGESES